MASLKVTFTLDERTIRYLQISSERLSIPKSEVVREAIQSFHDRLGRLSDRERSAMLRTFDELVPKLPKRSAASLHRELSELRKSRHSGGRLTNSEPRAK